MLFTSRANPGITVLESDATNTGVVYEYPLAPSVRWKLRKKLRVQRGHRGFCYVERLASSSYFSWQAPGNSGGRIESALLQYDTCSPSSFLLFPHPPPHLDLSLASLPSSVLPKGYYYTTAAQQRPSLRFPRGRLPLIFVFVWSYTSGMRCAELLRVRHRIRTSSWSTTPFTRCFASSSGVLTATND